MAAKTISAGAVANQRQVGSERHGLLKFICALLGVDFSGWNDKKFAQFMLSSNVTGSPSPTAVAIVSCFKVVRIQPDRTEYFASTTASAAIFKEFIGSKNRESRFAFTEDQNRMFQTKLKKPFRTLATVFLSYRTDYEQDGILWNHEGYQNQVNALRACDLMGFKDLCGLLKSAGKTTFREAEVKPTEAGLAAVEKAEKRFGEQRVRQREFRAIGKPRAPATTQREAITPLLMTSSPDVQPTPPARLTTSPLRPDPVHDHSLTDAETKALYEYYNRELARSMAFCGMSFSGVLFGCLGITTGCSVTLLDKKPVAARVAAADYPRIKRWIDAGCPS